MQVERGALDQLMVLANEQATETDTVTGSGAGAVEVDVVEGDEEEGDDWMTTMLQSELFSRMPMANIHQLFALLEPVEYEPGDVVITQGEPGEDYYIISEGRCAVFRKPSPKANEVKLAELTVGDSFGEEALISDSKRNATIKMLTKGVLMRLGKDTFIDLIKNPTLQAVNFDDAETLIEKGAKWLDVRFPNEHSESSVEGSMNVPLNALRMQSDKLDTNSTYILYCDTGGRSSTGAFLLAERGFTVSYLEGGLVNNPEAVGVQTVVPKAAPAAAETAAVDENDEELDADIRMEMLNAELESNEYQMQQESEKTQVPAVDDAKKKAHEENLKKLQAERKELEDQKKKAEAEAQQRTKQEEARLKKLKQEADRQMKEEKKKLEDIYNKNAEEMSKLQKMKEESETKLKKEQEKLEKQAEQARKQIEAAQKIKAQQKLEAKKQMEEAERLRKEIEESKKQLEEQAKQKRLQEEEREKELQAQAKAKIEAEKRKLAEQYERNSKEFEELQKQKAAAEAARAAAKEEAAKIIEEYKQSHDKEHEAARAKLDEERKKLEDEARQIRDTMKQIEQAKLEAEKIKQNALKEAESLREKQTESTSSESARKQIEQDILAAEEKAKEAEREIEDAIHKAKVTESAQQENEADILRKKQEQAKLMAQLNEEIENFDEELQSEAPSVTQIQMQADLMKRIKEKAAAAKKQAAQRNSNLLDDVARQLGED